MKIQKLTAYVTCFTTGLVILVMELVSFRLLAPYFGTSSYVTGIIINTVLLALAIGYYVGGYCADRMKWISFPHVLVFLTSVYMLFIYYLYPSILKGASEYNAIYGAFFAIVIMFFLPMVVLAFIPPYFIKILTTINTVGKIAGRIYSISTVGSIAGGALTTFVFVPYLGSHRTFIVAIVMLIVVSTSGLCMRNKHAVILLALILIPFIYVPTRNVDAIYQGESQYNIVTVIEKPCGSKYLHLNNPFGHHSESLKKNRMTGSYYDKFLLSPFLVDGNDILILGNGAGTSMTQLSYFFDARIDGVEIDALLTTVGKDILELRPDRSEVHTIHRDARNYLAQTDKTYDVIIIDLYAGSPYIPFHLVTTEFYKLVRSKLDEDGVVAINYPEYANNTRLEALYLGTIQSAFKTVLRSDNVLYAYNGRKSRKTIHRRMDQYKGDSNCLVYARKVLAGVSKTTNRNVKHVFTDDFAPIDRITYRILNI